MDRIDDDFKKTLERYSEVAKGMSSILEKHSQDPEIDIYSELAKILFNNKEITPEMRCLAKNWACTILNPWRRLQG